MKKAWFMQDGHDMHELCPCSLVRESTQTPRGEESGKKAKAKAELHIPCASGGIKTGKRGAAKVCYEVRVFLESWILYFGGLHVRRMIE